MRPKLGIVLFWVTGGRSFVDGVTVLAEERHSPGGTRTVVDVSTTVETVFEKFAPVSLREKAVVEQDRLISRMRYVAVGCAWAVFGLGATVLLGWIFGWERVTDVISGHVTMKANSAACFAALGIALALRLRGRSGWRSGVAWALAMLAMGCGVLTLVEDYFGVNLRIDQMLIVDPVHHQYPGRMAYLTAINFCLASFSVLLLRSGGQARKAGQAASAVLGMFALTAIVGSIYGVKLFYGEQVYSAMALHTGIGFLLLGAGLVLADEESTVVKLLRSKEPGSAAFRRVLPWVILMPVLVGWVYLQPWINFGSQAFSMAWFAVTLVAVALVALTKLSQSLNRADILRESSVRERERSAAAVRKSERELRLVTDHLPTLLSYIDKGGSYVRVNRTYEAWLGKPASQIVGRSMTELLGAAFWERVKPAHTRVLNGETVTFETTFPTVHGERHAQITYAPDLDEGGEVRGIACMVLDVNQRWEAESATRQAAKLVKVNEDLAHRVATDQLTGMKNRWAFEQGMRKAFVAARSHRKELSVLMVDVDNFKLRNDTWGHAAGDDVLRRLGEILNRSVREPDMAARYGGEEFTVLLPGSGTEVACRIAERIRLTVLEESWKETGVTVSIGVSSLNDHMMDAAELLNVADGALYEAKRAGKNQVHCS